GDQLARIELEAGLGEDRVGVRLARLVDARDLALGWTAAEPEVELDAVLPDPDVPLVVADVLVGLALDLAVVVPDHRRGRAARPEIADGLGVPRLQPGNVDPSSLEALEVRRLHVRGFPDGVDRLDAGHAGSLPQPPGEGAPGTEKQLLQFTRFSGRLARG